MRDASGEVLEHPQPFGDAQRPHTLCCWYKTRQLKRADLVSELQAKIVRFAAPQSVFFVAVGQLHVYLINMLSKNLLFGALFIVLAALVLDSRVEARYLPTRSSSDQADKLRELLKQLLESEIEREEMGDVPRWHPESKLFYKREAQAPKPPSH